MIKSDLRLTEQNGLLMPITALERFIDGCSFLDRIRQAICELLIEVCTDRSGSQNQ